MQEKSAAHKAANLVRSALESDISDLKKKRDELNQQCTDLDIEIKKIFETISTLQDRFPNQGADFSEKTIPEAVAEILKDAGQVMRPDEIIEEMERRGRFMNTENKNAQISSVLHQREKNVGDIVRHKRGQWGLKEWYEEDSTSAAKSDETEQPSLPPETVGPHSSAPL